MLKIGDKFVQGDLLYKVIGKDGQGRAVSTLVTDTDDEAEVETAAEDDKEGETKKRRSTKKEDETKKED